MPRAGKPLVQGDWDALNALYRSDVIRGLRWKPVYSHDWLFSQEASRRAGGQWTKIGGVGGVHFLSWDTYELPRPLPAREEDERDRGDPEHGRNEPGRLPERAALPRGPERPSIADKAEA